MLPSRVHLCINGFAVMALKYVEVCASFCYTFRSFLLPRNLGLLKLMLWGGVNLSARWMQRIPLLIPILIPFQLFLTPLRLHLYVRFFRSSLSFLY